MEPDNPAVPEVVVCAPAHYPCENRWKSTGRVVSTETLLTFDQMPMDLSTLRRLKIETKTGQALDFLLKLSLRNINLLETLEIDHLLIPGFFRTVFRFPELKFISINVATQQPSESDIWFEAPKLAAVHLGK